jgi:hypothetical protein
MNTNITKRIHINPQSKGSLGKSFEAEFRTAWLDYNGSRVVTECAIPPLAPGHWGASAPACMHPLR